MFVVEIDQHGIVVPGFASPFPRRIEWWRDALPLWLSTPGWWRRTRYEWKPERVSMARNSVVRIEADDREHAKWMVALLRESVWSKYFPRFDLDVRVTEILPPYVHR